MIGEPGPRTHGLARSLPLWGLFLAVAVVAWQLVEVNANLKAQSAAIRDLKQPATAIGNNLSDLASGARLGWPGYWKSVEGIRDELKLLREGKRGPGPPKGTP
jgi:hypothetical protein